MTNYSQKVSPELGKKQVDQYVENGDVSKKNAPYLQKLYEETGLARYKCRIVLAYQDNKWVIKEAKYADRIWYKGYYTSLYPEADDYLNNVNATDAYYLDFYGDKLDELKKWLNIK